MSKLWSKAVESVFVFKFNHQFLHKGCLYICQGSNKPFHMTGEDEVKRRRRDYSDYYDDVERGVPLESIDKETKWKYFSPCIS